LEPSTSKSQIELGANQPLFARKSARTARRRAISTAAAFVLVVSQLAAPIVALAVTTAVGVFETDGNAVDDTPDSAPDDFADIFAGSSSAITSAFIADGIADGSYFTGGGSKDVEDVSQWLHDGNSVPDKNEVTNAYAATYAHPVTNDTILYLGIDRYAANGSASIGFWLLQEELGMAADGTFRNVDTGSMGAHRENDMLVVADFQGGVPEIRIFFWQGGALQLSNQVINDCRTAPSADPVCGSANTVPEIAPWPYTPKSGPSGQFPVDSYLEVGINLNAVLGSDLGCFNTLVAESRSSTLVNAQQKDLLFSTFDICGAVSLEKSGPDLATGGSMVTYTFDITAGLLPMTVDSFTDDVLGDLTAVAAAACGTIQASATCSFDYDYAVPAGSAPGSVTNTAEVSLLPPNGIQPVTAGATHTLELFDPALSITKSIAAGAVTVGADEYANPGDVVTYEFTVTNSSTAAPTLGAPDLIFTDTSTPLDDGFVTDDVIGALRTAAAADGCDRLATGTSCTFTVDYTLTAGDLDIVAEVITNTVAALYHPEGFADDVTASTSHTVLARPDLSISKDDGVTSAATGDTVLYTITYDNVGYADATGVTITETVPVATTFDSGGSTAGWSCADGAPAGSVCAYDLGTLDDVDPAATLTFAVTVDASLAAGIDDVTNTATITDDDARPDADDTNETAIHVTPLDAAPDLTISKSDSTDDPTPGTTTTYTLSYANTGSQAATGVFITDTIPPGTTFNAAASSPGWSCPASVCIFDLGTLDVGASGTLQLALDIDETATGLLANTASIADDGSNGPDETPSDNTGTDSATLGPRADVSITKTDSVDPVAAGTQLGYTLTITNAGPSAAHDVVVTDTLPAGDLTFVSATPSSGSCSETAGTITCGLGVLGSGAVRTIAVVVHVERTQISDLVNIATVSTTSLDSNSSNNTAVEPTVVLNADTGIAKTVDDPTPEPGSSVTYTVIVTNGGDDVVTAVLVDDLLPAGVTYVSHVASVGAYNSSTGEWVIGSLAAPDSETLLLTATVDAGIPGTTIVNSAAVSQESPGDADLTNNSATAAITINFPPVASDNDYSTDEDTGLSGDVVVDDTGDGSDSDVDGSLDLSSVALDGDVTNGTLTLNSDGTFTYIPDADWNGTDSFTYTVTDNDGAISNTATVTITVAAVNDAPVATDDSDSTPEDTPVTVVVLVNDSDVDGDTLTVTSVSDPANGTAAVNGDGSVTYTPDPDFNGTDTFDYTISDGNGGADTATVTITVGAVNDAPVAVDDSASTLEDTAVVVAVLSNDSDVDGDSLSVVSTTAPANGSVLVNADNTITYTPNADFNGTDTFTYTISDGNGGTDTATVTITVAPVNDPPVATDNDYLTEEDTPVSGNVITDDTGDGIDSDLEGDVLSVTLLTPVTDGTLNLNADGSFTYTPDADFSGTDTFWYTLGDGNGGFDAAEVTIAVDANPDTVDDPYTTDEDTPLSVATPGVLDNDDLGNIPTTVTSFDATGTVGSVSIAADGALSYDPNGQFESLAVGDTATDTLTYTVTDADGDTSTATVTIMITGVNDNPVATDDSYSTTEDTPLVVSLPGVLGNDTDVDGDVLTVDGNTSPSNGTLTINPDGSLTYTPFPNFNGVDSFDYTITDGNGGTDTATVTITVLEDNDPPVAVDDSATTPQDAAVLVDAAANDSDVDGNLDPTTAVVVSGPANGSITNHSDGTFTYTPFPNFNGTDSFDYQICDDVGACDDATVTITVVPTPDLVDDGYATDEDTPITVPAPGVLGNDDLGAGLDTIAVTTQSSDGTVILNPDGSFTYTPDPDFFGTDTFVYEVCDTNGVCDRATVTITVNSVNDDPAAVDDTGSTTEDVPVLVTVLANDSDVDGDPLTVTSATDPANGSVVVNGDNTINYTPDTDFNGTDTFDYTISDGNGGTDTATVTITVDPVNDAPDAVDDTVGTDEDTPIAIPVLGNDSDPDGDPLSVTSATDPANGSVVVNGDNTITYTPDTDFNGTDTFDYTISDGNGGTDTATVTITVASVNDAPAAADDSDITGEDVPVTTNVVANDSDVDGTIDPSSVVVGNGVNGLFEPLNGSVTANGDGTITYSPHAGFNGVDVYEYQVCDSGTPVLCDVARVTVTVVPNVPPTAADDSATTPEDTPVVVDVVANDTDVDGTIDPTSVALASAPANGTVTIDPVTGEITYTPDPDFHGTDTLTYTVADDDGVDSAPASVTITVDPINDPPVAVDDFDSTNADTALNVAAPGVLGNDSDADGDGITVTTIDTTGTTGTVSVNADGSFAYEPAGAFASLPPSVTVEDTFTYTIIDGNGGTDTATVTITIVGTGDTPQAVDDIATTPEDTPVTIDVAVNDSDVDGDLDPTAVTVDSAPANGTAVVNGDGTVTYTPDPDFFGTDTFTYQICDTSGLCDLATVTVTVSAVEDAPVARDDSETTDEDVPVTVPVLLNDTDAEGNLDPNSVAVMDPPANGTATVNPDGTITYTPDLHFHGTDTFEYEVCDLHLHPGPPLPRNRHIRVRGLRPDRIV
jgi:uncharacterized repeat protein (TIGR01451 family)